MRFENGSQSPRAILVAVVLVMIAPVVLPRAALSVAQERSGQVDYFTESFPAKLALAKIEADGHSAGEARHLLRDRLLKVNDSSNKAIGAKIVASVTLQNDQLYVHGSREYINRVKQQLIDIQELGLKQLAYTIRIIEVPTEEAKAIIEKWSPVGGSTSTSVVPASSTAFQTTSEFRISDALDEDQTNEFIRLGKLIASSKIVGENGAEVNARFGRDVQFAAAYEPAAYEPVKDKNVSDSEIMQPVIGTIHDGIKLGLIGAFDDNRENIQLKFRFDHTHFKGMSDPLKYESKNGLLTVQQPKFTSTGFQTACKAPINKTIALSSGPIIRESVVERAVPLIGRVPYVGEHFKYAAKAKESITSFILIRCQEHKAAKTVSAGAAIVPVSQVLVNKPK